MANNIRKISGSVNNIELIECVASRYSYSGPTIDVTTVKEYTLESDMRYLISYTYYSGMGYLYGRLNIVPFVYDGSNNVYTDSGYIDYIYSSGNTKASITIINNLNNTITFRVNDGSGGYGEYPVVETATLIKMNYVKRILI